MRYFLYSITILFTSLLAFYTSSNLILTIIVCVTLLSYFIFLEYSLRKKILPKIVKNNDLNNFLHDFLLSYLDCHEIKFSLNKANINISKDLKEELRILNEYSGLAILSNLESYFSSSLYSLFLSTLQNECKNSQENIKFVLEENSLRIKKREEQHQQNKKALWQFSFLWLVSFIIFMILRISLNNYFDKLKISFFYIVGVSIYFLIFFLSINLFIFLYYKREVKNG